MVRCSKCGTAIALEIVGVRLARTSDAAPELSLSLEVPDGSLGQVLHTLQYRLVQRALRESGGVKSHAARSLGVIQSTFFSLLRRLGDSANELPTEDPFTGPCTLAEARKLEVLLRDATGARIHVVVDLTRPGNIVRRACREVRLAIARRALERSAGNTRRAASLIGSKYTTLHTFLRRAASNDREDSRVLLKPVRDSVGRSSGRG